MSGTGITTPDTVIPNPESILRDYLIGQQWLRTIDVDDEPTLAYLPDDFGYAPSVPSLLHELGFRHAAITRVDGAHFIGADYRPSTAYPLPGSTAELLQNDLKSADFVWVAPDGREVLCHWNPFTYFQGDMLAYVGVIRWMGKTFGMSWRTGRHIARRVASYVDALAPLARTRYLFCPIGCDFNPPIPKLGFLLDRYNREVYPNTGIWLLSAGLDDYMQLIETERASLPRLSLDINPYWMGFYASRPEAKVRHHRLARKTIALEADEAERRAGRPASVRESAALQLRLWSDLAFANHHDFITGTSPDRVWATEQAPLLRDAEAAVDEAQTRRSIERPISVAPVPSVQLRRDGHRLTITTPSARFIFDEEQGGALVRWQDRDGAEMVKGPSLDLALYRDTGGLWRLGHEFAGGRFGVIERGQHQALSLRATRDAHGLCLTHRVPLGGKLVQRRIWLHAHRPQIIVSVSGALALGTSLCLQIDTPIRSQQIEMDVPGGVVQRPWRKLYDPTFWPAFSFAHVADDSRGLAMYLGGPSSVSWSSSGRLSAMVQRNAPKEMAYGFLPVLAHPARGTDPGFEVTCALAPTEGRRTSWLEVARSAHDTLAALALYGVDGEASTAVTDMITVDGEAFITALKPADRGPGFIVRLVGRAGGTVKLRGHGIRLTQASRCDARERDRHPLAIDEDGRVQVHMDGHTVSVRINIVNRSALRSE